MVKLNTIKSPKNVCNKLTDEIRVRNITLSFCINLIPSTTLNKINNSPKVSNIQKFPKFFAQKNIV